MNLVMEETRSQENCWKWVGKDIDTLKEGIKEIIDIFTDSPKPNKMEKIMIMTQNLSHDGVFMKCNHEKIIKKVQQSMEEIKNNLKNLVDISKEAMRNHMEGFEKINAMVTEYKSNPINSDYPGDSNIKKKLNGKDSSMDGNKTSGPISRTRSRRSNKDTSRFIMEDLEEINKVTIQKNKKLVHLLN